jgi:inositol-pentakisphosphate 2-kinase
LDIFRSNAHFHQGELGEVREFKPKWLCQSPTAPEDSVRCRQCARVACMNAERTRTGEQLKSHFCPLYLVSDEDRDLEYAARQLAVYNISSERIFKFLKTTPLLRTLRDLQDRLDKVGILEGDVADDKFLAAMTLRDCSVFVRFADDYNGEEDGGVVDARLGDMDLKNPKKREYWRSIEEQLISEGWYQGTEREEDMQAPMCWLEYTTRWDSDSE